MVKNGRQTVQTNHGRRMSSRPIWTYMKERHAQGPYFTSLYPANTGYSEVIGQRLEGMVWWWGEGKTYFEVLARAFLGEVSCCDDIPPKWAKLS